MNDYKRLLKLNDEDLLNFIMTSPDDIDDEMYMSDGMLLDIVILVLRYRKKINDDLLTEKLALDLQREGLI